MIALTYLCSRPALGRLALTLLLVLAAPLCRAATFYVAPGGSDSAAGTQAAPLLTIQHGINLTLNGDTVIVESGTYTGPGDVDLDFGGKNITVTSQSGPAYTVINCGGSSTTDHRGFYLHSGETAAVISGFTIENGYETYVSGTADSGNGGGICIDGSSAVIQNCTISANTASGGKGGGVFNYNNGGGMITLTNCTLSGNTADDGGGVFNYNNGGGMITLTNCTLSGNTATYNGGGVFNVISNAGTITLTNCAISGNTATNDGGVSNNNNGGGMITLTNCAISGNTASGGEGGGGVYNFNGGGGTITLTNCAISGNTASGGGGVYNQNSIAGTITLTNCAISGNTASGGEGGGVYNFNFNGGTITLTNDIVYGDTGGEAANDPDSTSNAAVTYCDVQGGYTGNNLNSDPMFLNAPTNLHLQPGSPCIGRGTHTGAPATDLDGIKRNNPPSIGAYEGGLPLSVPSIYPTIQVALNAAGNGQTVTVADGIYTGPGNVDLDFGGRNLTLTSASGNPARTIINCQGARSDDGSGDHRGIYLHSGETSAVVRGLTIENGYESNDNGGGILNLDQGTTIQNCVVTNCLAGNSGGGIYNGGVWGSGPITLTNCVIMGNEAQESGGGVYNATSNDRVNMTNCTVTGNSAGSGGGGQRPVGQRRHVLSDQ